MITGKGAAFLFVAVLVFVLARFTQVGWLYLVDAVLWGMFLLSAVLPWSGVAFLSVQRLVDYVKLPEGLPGPCEGDPVRIELSVQNRAFWPRFVFSMFYDCSLAEPGSRLRRLFVAYLGGSGRASITSEITAYQRGMQQLGPVMLEASAPFGLFRRRARKVASQQVLVYPKVYPLKRFALVDAPFGTAATPAKSRVGMEPVGSRRYLPGDPRRHIHWRNTARTGRLMVKEFDDPSDQTLHLLFDATQVWGAGKETTLEYSIKIVASAADYALRNRVMVRIWGGRLQGEESGPFQGGGLSRPELLRGLAQVIPGEGLKLHESLAQAPPGCSALVVVSGADRQSIEAISRAAPALHRLVVVVLEGFGETPGDADHLGYVSLGSLPLVMCRPGHLLEAFQFLGQPGETFSGRGAGPGRDWQ